MVNAKLLINLHFQLKTINTQLTKGLAEIVGTKFKCSKSRVHEKETEEIEEFTVCEYDYDHEEFEVVSSKGEYYFVNELALLVILDEIDSNNSSFAKVV